MKYMYEINDISSTDSKRGMRKNRGRKRRVSGGE